MFTRIVCLPSIHAHCSKVRGIVQYRQHKSSLQRSEVSVPQSFIANSSYELGHLRIFPGTQLGNRHPFRISYTCYGFWYFSKTLKLVWFLVCILQKILNKTERDILSVFDVFDAEIESRVHFSRKNQSTRRSYLASLK